MISKRLVRRRVIVLILYMSRLLVPFACLVRLLILLVSFVVVSCASDGKTLMLKPVL